MRVLTPAFVGRFAGRMLNIHPSLLPKYPGLHTHQRAIEAGYRSLAALFADLDAHGRLRVDDPLRAAQHFHWLALSVPMNTVMFIEKSYSAQEIDDYATSAVRVFLAAYGVSRRA